MDLVQCEAEAEFRETSVRYKWLRPIKIGNRNETEWTYVTKPFPEFMQLLRTYYQDSYRLHNWVYKYQDKQRRECRKRLQRGRVISEYDYAAKATQFQQEAMPCSAARRTSQFVVFCHFDPTIDDAGNNIADTTEVYTFHSNCLTQDTHSIRRCLLHVLQDMRARGHLDDWSYFFADGCMAQNKGRKALRQYSELSAELSIHIMVNFPATAHFAGPWDTEGARQTKAIKNHILNERDLINQNCVLDAGDNVRTLREIINKVRDICMYMW